MNRMRLGRSVRGLSSVFVAVAVVVATGATGVAGIYRPAAKYAHPDNPLKESRLEFNAVFADGARDLKKTYDFQKVGYPFFSSDAKEKFENDIKGYCFVNPFR